MSLEELPERFDGVVLANELLDNLPVALAIRSGDGWIERWVGATDDRFGFVTAPARPEVVAWCDAYAGTVPEGGMVEVQLAAGEWMRRALGPHRVGTLSSSSTTAALPRSWSRAGPEGTLRTYRSHHLGPDPLLEPGATDVTVDVNFTALWPSPTRPVRVSSCTARTTSSSLRSPRGRHAPAPSRTRPRRDTGDAMERLLVRSEATDAETLLHPRGLGDFRVA